MAKPINSDKVDIKNASVVKQLAKPDDEMLLVDSIGNNFKTTMQDMINLAGNGYAVSQVEGHAPYNNIQDAIDKANLDWISAGSPDTTIKVKVLVGIYAPGKGAPLDGIITLKRGVFVEWDSTAGGSPGARSVNLTYNLI